MLDVELVSQREVQQIILEVCTGDGATEDDMKVAVDWAQETRLRAILLLGVLQGKMGMGVEDGEVTFYMKQVSDNQN